MRFTKVLVLLSGFTLAACGDVTSEEIDTLFKGLGGVIQDAADSLPYPE